MYQALYRKYRPEVLEDVIGQEHVVRIIRNQITRGNTCHAYLLCGTRGTGKTTTARLIAKGLNCLSDIADRPCGKCEACLAIQNGVFVDVAEIDAASNNSIEDVRELRESVNFPPAQGRTKVYIIDEVHMISQKAANALLKTLEEPPENIVFILATTEPTRLPQTILSRCLRFDFRRVPVRMLTEHFSKICEDMGVKAAPEALSLIAANSDGSVRDGLSLLDRCISGMDEIKREDVLDMLGLASMDIHMELADAVAKKDVSGALVVFSKTLAQGKEPLRLATDLIEHFRNLLMVKCVSAPEDIINLSLENIEKLKEQAEGMELADIRRCITELSRALADAKWAANPGVFIELALIKLAS